MALQNLSILQILRGEFIANSDGSKFGTIVNNEFVPYDIFFTPNVPTVNPMLSVPLTLEAMENNVTVTFVSSASGPVTYKINGGTAQIIESEAVEYITLDNVGDRVEFYGNNTTYATTTSDFSNITCNKDCYVYGNIMSLINSENYESTTTLTGTYTFCSLFRDNTYIKNKDGADLLLPATTLTKSCYNSMFYGCTSLTTAPALPATTLADYCYESMFNGCISLTAAPELPATILTRYCYVHMFENCTDLTSAPVLPATTLAYGCYASMFMYCTNLTISPVLHAATLTDRCYESMFGGCTNLNEVTCLATDISASTCIEYWLSDVASTGTFTKAANMSKWTTFISGGSGTGIPSGWTVQDYIA